MPEVSKACIIFKTHENPEGTNVTRMKTGRRYRHEPIRAHRTPLREIE